MLNLLTLTVSRIDWSFEKELERAERGVTLMQFIGLHHYIITSLKCIKVLIVMILTIRTNFYNVITLNKCVLFCFAYTLYIMHFTQDVHKT